MKTTRDLAIFKLETCRWQTEASVKVVTYAGS